MLAGMGGVSYAELLRRHVQRGWLMRLVWRARA